MLTGSSDGVTVELSARIAFLALVVGLLWVWRRMMIALLGYRPGPVDVMDLIDATAGQALSEPRVQDLGAQFRKQLSATNLYPPESSHSEPPPPSFLDLLGDVNPDPKKLGASVLQALGRLRPKIAYRVTGTLHVREPEPQFGMTVMVTAYLTGSSSMTTVWDRSWQDVMSRAAFWVMATILPVTRACSTPPWRDWRSLDLPADLFAAYQQARLFSNQQQFDKAMEKYYEALHYDPMNPYLRSELGAVQERLGLLIDALDSYQGALAISCCGDSYYDHRLWAPWWQGRGPGFILYQWRHPESIDIRYNYTRVLSVATARQWCEHGSPSKSRAEARDEIRRRLIPVLVDRYWRAVVDLDPDGVPAAIKKISAKEADLKSVEADARRMLKTALTDNSSEAEKKVNFIFQRAAAQELYRLVGDRALIWRTPRKRFTRTRKSLKICRDALVPLRLSQAWADLPNQKCCDRLRRDGWRRKVWVRATSIDCPAQTAQIKKRITTALYPMPTFSRSSRRYGPRRRDEWQDHYNAACVYAVAMKCYKGQKKAKVYQEFLDLAIKELRKAVGSAHSGFTTVATSKQWWMLVNDTDLEEVRRNAAFAQFERDTYPDRRPAPSRPGDAHAFELTAYDLQLIERSAQAMEQTWHHRSEIPEIDIHRVAEWFRAEEKIWDRVSRFATGEGRDWTDRADLLDTVAASAEPNYLAVVGFPPPVPKYDTVPDGARPSADDIEVWVESRIGHVDDILKRLGKLISSELSSPKSRIKEWRAEVEAADRAGAVSLPRIEIRRVCAHYAAAWQALGEWFSGPERASQEYENQFREALQRIPRATSLVSRAAKEWATVRVLFGRH